MVLVRGLLEKKELSLTWPKTIDAEAWVKEWAQRSLPIYQNAYHAFMGFVKDKKSSGDDIELEASCFYDALEVTREFTSNSAVINQLAKSHVPPSVQPDIYKILNQINEQLDSVDSRCIESDGVRLIAKEDLLEFIRLIVELISKLSIELTALIERSIQPFNDFIKEIDSDLQLDLVEGDYHFLVQKELENAESENLELKRKVAKVEHFKSIKSKVNTEVYVICDKPDLVEYIEERWVDKVLLTVRAKNCLLESGFSNLKLLPPIFDILANEFYDCYLNDTGIETPKEVLRHLNAEFKPKLSASSKSNHSIFKTKYKSRKASFDRHICLGGSLSPERCFRIHFEWDDEEQLIVIHHAGNHLPMGSDK